MANLNISEVTQQRWRSFIERHALPAIVLEHAEELQNLWQQSLFSERVCQQQVDVIASLFDLDKTSEMGRAAYCEQLRSLLADTEDEEEFKQRIRTFRNQQLLQLCWRDLILQQDIKIILSDLSTLADACIEVTLQWATQLLSKNYGDYPQLMVIALGKLGGYELNFSSDIDLMFCYANDEQEKPNNKLSEQEYFTQLAQKFIHLLSSATVDGFVYRVDCRLRPFGDSGPLVVNFNHLEDYYQVHGREWERYALIKARVVCGSERDVQEFNALIKAFVYRKYIDFGVIETLRSMRAMITQQEEQKGSQDNIKLGVGGIREIEFIVQFFQLVKGGRNTRLQTQRILVALYEIQEAGYLEAKEVEQLIASYLFLRRVENRLQMDNDQQTHRLPQSLDKQLTLAQSMQFAAVEDFVVAREQYMRDVRNVFAAISTASDGDNQRDCTQVWQEVLEAQEVDLELMPSLQTLGDAEHVVKKLFELKQSLAYRNQDAASRERWEKFVPVLIQCLYDVDSPGLVIDRLFMLLTKIMRRSTYLMLLIENQMALKQLVSVVAASPWIANHITAYPLLLDELSFSPDEENQFQQENLSIQFQQQVRDQPGLDYEQVLERVRAYKHTHELHVACADIQGYLPLMRVSDQLSWLAESVVAGCLHYVEQDSEAYLKDNLAVIALGKLGGLELSYGSDLDLIFISNNLRELEVPADEQGLYVAKISKLAQRLMQMLTLQTVSGRLYEVDMRLRPDGQSGPIVPMFDYVQEYYTNRAWVWELQALVRARCVAGTEVMCQRFAQLREEIICKPRDPQQLAHEVAYMRKRMLVTKRSRSKEIFNLKNDEGGITDIEFMVQYAVLAQANQNRELCRFSDNVRLLELLAGDKFLSSSVASQLTEIYCRYRDATHRLALQAQKTELPIEEFVEERRLVRELWQEIIESNAQG